MITANFNIHGVAWIEVEDRTADNGIRWTDVRFIGRDGSAIDVTAFNFDTHAALAIRRRDQVTAATEPVA